MSEVTVRREGAIAIITITLPDQFMTNATVGELNAATEEHLHADDWQGRRGVQMFIEDVAYPENA